MLAVVPTETHPRLLHMPARTVAEPRSEHEASASFAMIPRAVLDLHDGYAMAVYAALASYANDQRECWPSIGTLAEALGWSERHIGRMLNKLETAGLIVRERRTSNGMKAASLYRLVAEDKIGLPVRTIRTTVRQDRTDSPSGSAPQSDKQEPIEQEPIEPIPPKSPKGNAYTPEFDEFWRAYPKDHGVKLLAFKQWQKLTADERAKARAAVDVWRGSRKWQGGFIRECQRWLEYREWEQEVEAAPVPATNGKYDIPMPPEIERLRYDSGAKALWEIEHTVRRS